MLCQDPLFLGQRRRLFVCERGGLASPDLDAVRPPSLSPVKLCSSQLHVWRQSWEVLVEKTRPAFGCAWSVPPCSLRLWIISERFSNVLCARSVALEQFSHLLVILIGWTLTAQWTDLDVCCFFLFVLILFADFDLSADESLLTSVRKS